LADSLTDFLALVKPEVGASPNTWGDKLNADLDDIDAALQSLVEAGNFAVAAGADAIAISLAPPPSAYATGLQVRVKAEAANTGAVTLNVNGLGAKAVKYPDGSALPAGALTAGVISQLDYNGSVFVLSSPVTASAAETQGATSTNPITPASAAVSNSAGVTEWALGGLYIKCGTVSVTSAPSGTGGAATVTFPTAFPTACDAVVLGHELASGAVADIITEAFYCARSTTGVTIGVDRDFGADQTYQVSWLALGR
jgi:hypothetical protein